MPKQKKVTKTLTTAPFRGSFFTSGYPLTEPLPNASKYDNPPTDTQLEKFVKNREKIVSPIVMDSLKKHPEDVLHGSRSLAMLLPEFREPGDWDLFSPREKVRAQSFERSLDNKMKADIAKTVPVTLVESVFTARQPGSAEHLYRVVVPNSGMDAEIDVISKPRKLQTVKKDGITHESIESQYKRLDIRKDQITHMEKATRDKHFIEDYWKSKGLTVLPTQEEKPWMKPFSKTEKVIKQKGKKQIQPANNFPTPFTQVNWVKESPLPLRDTDRDSIPDIFDCAPLDPFKQGIFHDFVGKVKDTLTKKSSSPQATPIPEGEGIPDEGVPPVSEPTDATATPEPTIQEQSKERKRKSTGERIDIEQDALKEKSFLRKQKEKYGLDKALKKPTEQEDLRKRKEHERRLKTLYERFYEHYFYRDSTGYWQYYKSIPLKEVDSNGLLVDRPDRNINEARMKIQTDLTKRYIEWRPGTGNPNALLKQLRDADSLGKTYKKNLTAKFKAGAAETLHYDRPDLSKMTPEQRRQYRSQLPSFSKLSGKAVDTSGKLWESAKKTMGVNQSEKAMGPDKRWGYKDEEGTPIDRRSGMPSMALPAWGSVLPSRAYKPATLKRSGVKAILSPDEYKSLLEQGWTQEDLEFRGIVSKRSPNYQEQSVFGKGVVPYRPIGMYQAMLPKQKRKPALFYPAPLTYEDVFFNPMNPVPRQEEQQEAINLSTPEEEQQQEGEQQ